MSTTIKEYISALNQALRSDQLSLEQLMRMFAKRMGVDADDEELAAASESARSAISYIKSFEEEDVASFLEALAKKGHIEVAADESEDDEEAPASRKRAVKARASSDEKPARVKRSANSENDLGPRVQIFIEGLAAKLAAAMGIKREVVADGKTPIVERAAFKMVAPKEGGLRIDLHQKNLARAVRFLRKRTADSPNILNRASVKVAGTPDTNALARAHVVETKRGFKIA